MFMQQAFRGRGNREQVFILSLILMAYVAAYEKNRRLDVQLLGYFLPDADHTGKVSLRIKVYFFYRQVIRQFGAPGMRYVTFLFALVVYFFDIVFSELLYFFLWHIEGKLWLVRVLEAFSFYPEGKLLELLHHLP